MSTEETLKERGSKYGEFGEHARITQNIKAAMVDSPNWKLLPDNMKEALEMIAHKVGRILNGDPTYHDSWHDIIGYTKLVANSLIPKEERKPDTTDALSSAINEAMDKLREKENRRRAVAHTRDLVDQFFGIQKSPYTDGWIPFTATRDSVCPVDPSMRLSIITVQSRREGRVLPPALAGERHWDSCIHNDAVIVAYKVEKQP